MLSSARYSNLNATHRILSTTRFRTTMSSNAVPTPAVYMTDGGGNEEIAKYQKHQASMMRPTASEQARTMMRDARFGLLSTVNGSGSPQSSVVDFALEEGLPIFATSNLSSHTKDMLERGEVALLCLQKGFEDITGARFSLNAKVKLVTEADKVAQLRSIFLSKYPQAFYVDFPDFNWFQATEVMSGRWIGGFAQAKTVSPAEYLGSQPDPVSAFSPPVCGHMNQDHADDMMAMISHYAGLKVESPVMTSLDKLGINFSVKISGSPSPLPLRINYPSPAEDRKAIKEQIVAMTRAAKGV
jgi:putative heme iron utilization protein